jgi:inhibitor of cysteine peptidase
MLDSSKRVAVGVDPQIWTMTTLRLDLRSSGQTVNVAPEDRLELKLEENPTTGFRWYIEDDKSGVLTLEHDAFTRLHNGVSGAGGTRDFVFTIAKSGQAVLRASYRRSWERQKPAQTAFELIVLSR